MSLLDNLLFVWCPALAAFCLILAAGSRLLPGRWLALPSPWPAALAGVIGWHFAALLVLLVGIGGSLTGGHLLAGFWLPLATLAGWSSVCGRFPTVFGFVLRLPTNWGLVGPWRPAVLLCGLFLILVAGIATAPPSKHDDLHYHLVVPHRGLIEKGWVFHATPYLQAAPHVAHQMLLTPLLAVGRPAATGVFSLLWGVWLVVLVFERVRRVSLSRAVLAAAVLLVSFDNAVWWVSPSPTAVSALWSSMLFLWLLDRDELYGPGCLGLSGYAAGATLLASALFLSKMSFLLPAGLALLVVLLGCRPMREMLRAFGAMAFVGAVTAGPWLAWCAMWSGNPLGFAGVELFGSSVFDSQALSNALDASRRVNQNIEFFGFRDVLLLHPLLAVGLGIPALVKMQRWDILAAVSVSSVGLAWVVPHAPRFHLFALDGLLLAAVLATPTAWLPDWAVRLAPALVFLASVPAVAATGYYASVFWPAVLGMQSRDDFLLQRTSLYDVWTWCNRETPVEARFGIDLERHPRLFYLDRLALAPEGVTIGERAEKYDLLKWMSRHRLDYLLTEHPQAPGKGVMLVRKFEGVVVEAYRTPNQPPQRGTVWLYRIANGEADSRISAEGSRR